MADKLKSAGCTTEQAEAVVRVKAQAQNNLVTRKDLDAALSPSKTDLAVLRTEVSQIKWMLGFVIVGIVAVLAKLLSYQEARAAFLALDPLLWQLTLLALGGLGNHFKPAAPQSS